MYKTGDYVQVNKKIYTLDQYNPPRKTFFERCGIIVKEHKKYPSVQFYIDFKKVPSLPEKVPYECLDKITREKFLAWQ